MFKIYKDNDSVRSKTGEVVYSVNEILDKEPSFLENKIFEI